MRCRSSLRLTTWLALVVMLLGAFAPTVSRALVAARGAAIGVDICTSQGPRGWTPARAYGLTAQTPQNFQAEVSHDGRESGPVLDHCPFCLLAADWLGPPPAASSHFFHADSDWAPPGAQALFFQTTAFSPALPRGPPVIL